jgi:hypothetical protein
VTDTLPIDAALPALIAALGATRQAVLQAPPGAGKTTRVPLALLNSGLVQGRIMMLEPRRLAARAAADRMAETLGEAVGATVGYRIRGEAKVSRATRIEVVTEGILTRMIQSDPSLDGIGAVIFDEFHERSLNADLGLALALEVRAALRDDLVLIVMSATLDAAPVAALMGDAPVITSAGRAFPVETRWLPKPVGPLRFEPAMADLILQAVSETAQGGVLAFLPGEGEIRKVEALLKGRLPDGCVVRPLFGAMDFTAQRAATGPVAEGRRIVLATSIAETSLTLPDIRVVVDGGRSRRARFDPASGMSRLVTERVTRAEAEQRRGRAGRVAEGLCYRLWTRAEEGGLAPWHSGAARRALPFSRPPIPACWPRRAGFWQPWGRWMLKGASPITDARLPPCPCIRALATCCCAPGPRVPPWQPCWQSGIRCAAHRRTWRNGWRRCATLPGSTAITRVPCTAPRSSASAKRRAVWRAPSRRALARPCLRQRWPPLPTPTASGCAARAMPRAGCFPGARAR